MRIEGWACCNRPEACAQLEGWACCNRRAAVHMRLLDCHIRTAYLLCDPPLGGLCNLELLEMIRKLGAHLCRSRGVVARASE